MVMFILYYLYSNISLSITIEDGVFDITSNDDGLNAGGGADSSGFSGFGARQQDTFTASSNCFIRINGGTFTIVSTGDCVDSNGSLTINGGTLALTCNGSGNTAIDCDGAYANNGGDITHQRWLGDQPRPDERRPRRNGQPSRYRWPRWCAWSR